MPQFRQHCRLKEPALKNAVQQVLYAACQQAFLSILCLTPLLRQKGNSLLKQFRLLRCILNPRILLLLHFPFRIQLHFLQASRAFAQCSHKRRQQPSRAPPRFSVRSRLLFQHRRTSRKGSLHLKEGRTRYRHMICFFQCLSRNFFSSSFSRRKSQTHCDPEPVHKLPCVDVGCAADFFDIGK